MTGTEIQAGRADAAAGRADALIERLGRALALLDSEGRGAAPLVERVGRLITEFGATMAELKTIDPVVWAELIEVEATMLARASARAARRGEAKHG